MARAVARGRRRASSPGRPDAGHDHILRLIALFKFCKAAFLVAAGLGALELLRPGIADGAEHWLTVLASNVDRHVVQQVLARVSGLSPSRLEALGAGAFLYAALFTAEGVGLWLEKRWAEYLTVIATASFLPFEVYELLRQVTLPRLSALVLNLVVVVYLIYRLRRPRHGRPTAASNEARRGRAPGPLPSPGTRVAMTVARCDLRRTRTRRAPSALGPRVAGLSASSLAWCCSARATLAPRPRSSPLSSTTRTRASTRFAPCSRPARCRPRSS
ncbi:MAG TPA: DUF2127 domain-containing protein [Polyangium sp.]|nr:DUF2127 domain-containing protein [Polyangium sp.]